MTGLLVNNPVGSLMPIGLAADLSDPLTILLAVLVAAILILVIIVWRLSAQRKTSKSADRILHDEVSRLGLEFTRQLEFMQNNLASRVLESNREQREINSLFMTQLQQYGQGSGQQMESVRRSVAESLGKVSGSLLEMQNVTAEVRQLKQILGNVKTRGIIGELSLERLLADALPAGLYLKNVRIKPDKQETVEFAIRMPGGQDANDSVLLPIDAKFPLDYLSRLLAAQDAGDLESAEVFRKELLSRVRQDARKISSLYVVPPKTTDFGILYLPTESLFAEVIRETDLASEIYRKYRIVIAGPSSLTALLSSLQATFRLQALEQKSLLIAQSLGEIQRDFNQFEDSLEKVKNRLSKALNEVEDSGRKASRIRRRLDNLNLAEWNDVPPDSENEEENTLHEQNQFS